MKTKSWLRLYHEFADDPKIQMLAFEDQRHFVMVLCLKGRGVLDSNTPTAEYRERMIAKALGLDPLTSREVKFRLVEPGLIDENWQPVAWAERQFESDNSTERVQKYRDKRKRFGNVSSRQEPEPDGQTIERVGNVSVTAQIRSEQSKNSPPGNSYEAKTPLGEQRPSGSPAAKEPDPKPRKKPKVGDGDDPPAYDVVARRAHWWGVAITQLVADAWLFEIVPRGIQFDRFPERIRESVKPILQDAVGFALDREENQTLEYREIVEGVQRDATRAIREIQKSTPDERTAMAA